MSKRLVLQLLGRLEIQKGGIPLNTTQADKTMALLSYLAVTGRSHTRSALAGLLWGGLPEARARGNLSKALSTLGQVDGEHLTITRQIASFNQGSHFWLDVTAFEADVSDGSIESLQAAVGLYQGDFLDGFAVRHAPEFEDWVLAQGVRLKALALQALHTLAAYFAEQGKPGRIKAIDYTNQLLRLEPWREEAHRQLMQLYTQIGQQTAALRQYQICVDTLQAEFGLPPSPETMALFEQIRSGELAEPAADAQLETPHNLPTQTTPFVGRGTELAELGRLLANPDSRLITILGPGGMGKTRLAQEVAAVSLDHFPHGIFFVRLASLSTGEEIVSAVAEAVGFSFQTDGRNPSQQLLDYLGEKSMLLVLDNFEHLLGGVDLVVDILQTAPRIKVIATSREALKLQEEQQYLLHGLDYATWTASGPLSLGPVDQFAAVQLFVGQAQRVQPAFRPDEDDLVTIARICQLVAGLPLGIILAAAWIKLLTPAEIVAEISESQDILVSEMRNLPIRQRSMQVVFDHSWRLLTEAEKVVFGKLSTFRGGFTREAAQAVAGARLPVLMGLVDKSMIQRTTSGRFDIHQLLRQYGGEKLDEAGQLKAALELHTAYFLDQIAQLEPDLKGHGHLEALAIIEADQNNIRAAWQWAVEHDQIERSDRALEALTLFFDTRNFFNEGFEACALVVRRWADEPKAQKIVARALIRQSKFGRKLGHHVSLTRQHLQRALSLLAQAEAAGLDVRADKAWALLKIGDLTWYQDSEMARQYMAESLVLSRAIDDRWLIAWVLRELIRTHWALGHFKSASVFGEESVAIRRSLGNRHEIASSLRTLGYQYAYQGDLEAHDRLAQEAYEIYLKMDHHSGTSIGLHSLGFGRCRRGDFFGALAMYEQAWDIIVELNDRHHMNTMRWTLAEAKLHLGEYGQALIWGQQALDHAKEIGLQSHEGDALLRLGMLKIADGAYEEARVMMEESAVIYRRIVQPVKLGDLLGPLCLAYLGLGDLKQARKFLVELLQIGTEQGNFLALQNAIPIAAMYLVEIDSTEQAVEIYALASRDPYIANSRWFADVVGRQIAVAAAALPSAVIEAARARGRARDLDSTARELLAGLKANIIFKRASTSGLMTVFD